MPSITSDQIRDISVKAVEGFLNNKIPLSEGLSKQASAMQLNSDQIQRAVEATNSIAYLKVLELSSDRTVEFPLCKYAEVMAKVALPEEIPGMAKAAFQVPALLKSASVKEEYIPSELTNAELRMAFIKQAALNDAELQRMKDRSVTIVPELMKVASNIRDDKRGLEKLATIVAGDTFSSLSQFVYGKVQMYADTGMFKEAELKTVKNLTELIKEAQELQASIKEKQALADRSNLVKEAFLGAIGSGIGRVAGSVISAPFKMLGKGIGNSAANVAGKATNFAKSKLGMPVSPMAKRIGIGAALIPAATIGFDATMYSPGVHKETGTSQDAWTALQRQ
jgi:hypothetical protein